MKVEIEESKLQTAYANACDGVKDFMESLFGKKVFEAAKPTLDDYKTIRTYEDACKALGEPIFEDPNNLPNHIIALMKLETISRALWGRNFQPKPDGEGSKVYWYPWFALWTKKEVEDMNPEQRGALLSALAWWCGCGFRFSVCDLSFLECGCVHWVPLVPRNGRKGKVFRAAIH
ncbi:hypothetical protein [Bacteroides sp. 2201st1_D9_2201SCRN_220225]|uniref:hypothetical protein n=1 Tax=Bacteroides sp. 2201st1_D9_2201SCRN_220225 TaxID=3143218 RepID=UPI0034A2FE8A